VRFFFDNCISPKIVEALKLLDDQGHTYEHLKWKFNRGDLKDDEWLPKLKAEGDWIIISMDLFNKTQEENQLMREAGRSVYIFAEGHVQLPHWEIVRRIVTWWPRILDHAKSAKKGECSLIPMTSNKFRDY